jgi:hypothetical protein
VDRGRAAKGFGQRAGELGDGRKFAEIPFLDFRKVIGEPFRLGQPGIGGEDDDRASCANAHQLPRRIADRGKMMDRQNNNHAVYRGIGQRHRFRRTRYPGNIVMGRRLGPHCRRRLHRHDPVAPVRQGRCVIAGAGADVGDHRAGRQIQQPGDSVHQPPVGAPVLVIVFADGVVGGLAHIVPKNSLSFATAASSSASSLQ